MILTTASGTTTRNDKRLPLLLLFLVVFFYLLNGVQYLRSQSLTSDEGDFYRYAVRFLKGHPERIYPAADNSKMPVSVLNTIPRIVEQAVLHRSAKTDGGFSDIMNGRYVTLLFSVLTLLLVFTWAKQLYGIWAGVFAAFLFSFCPNNLANAGLVTTDTYSVFFLLLTFYRNWRFCRNATMKNLLWLSLAVAFSQLVKQSLFHLYVLVPLCTGVYFLTARYRPAGKNIVLGTAIFLLVNWVVINAGFYFYRTGLPLGRYNFMSDLFRGVQQTLPHWLPVPLPHPFVEGLDQAKYYDQVGGGFSYSSFANVTILGRSSTGGSFWYYYLVALFYKTPIAYFAFAVWAAVRAVKSREAFFLGAYFLLLPVIYYLFLMSCFYKTQCGLRHLIFVFPFLFIFCSGILKHGLPGRQTVALFLLSGYLVVSVLSYWRNYFPYTNEFILNKTLAYEKVGVDNLDFLQGGFFLHRYLKEHSDVQLPPKTYRSGTFAVSLKAYLDQWNTHEYEWIRSYKPVGNIARTYLLIRVTEKGN